MSETGAVLEELDRQECFRLIASGDVGRVAFNDGEGPAILPVNYVLDGESVLFRTTLKGRLHHSLTTSVAGAPVRIAFEIDSIDEAARTGWSVLLRGGAHTVSLEDSEAAQRIEPWPGGERDAFFRLDPTDVSGRRVRR